MLEVKWFVVTKWVVGGKLTFWDKITDPGKIIFKSKNIGWDGIIDQIIIKYLAGLTWLAEVIWYIGYVKLLPW